MATPDAFSLFTVIPIYDHAKSGYSDSRLYVVSAFRRTRHGPAKAGHYVKKEPL